MPWQRDALLEHLDGDQRTWAQPVAQQIRNQLPIPVPTKIGAVVQTDSGLCAPDPTVFIRWASDEQTPEPWELPEELDRKTYSTADLGRIIKVLSEGVDL
jgi:hypothetical protein